MGRISKLRYGSSFHRKQGNKTPRSITLIVCEGETEQKYFDNLRIHFGLSTAEIILADNTIGAAPISVVQCAVEKCSEPGGYDQVFCVFDRDGHESFDRARIKIASLAARKIKPIPIEESISVPCFEYWILLHFEKTDANFLNCADVVQRIRKRHMIDYKKASSEVSKLLMAKLDEALKNADWLEGRSENNGFDPYTSVHKILRHFISIAEK